MVPVLRDSLFVPVFGPANRLAGVLPRREPLGSGVPMALWQDQENVYFEADLPGVSGSDLDVSVHQGVLKVRGERKPVEGRRYLYNNRPFGRFERVVTLPEEVQTDGIQAEFVDGVLRVTLPKKPEAKPQRIAVQSN